MQRKTFHKILACLMAFTAMFLFNSCSEHMPLPLHVIFLDVEAGDAVLITCDNHAMLIDTGDSSHQSVIKDALDSRGIKRLDCMVLSHNHSDHIGNAAWILENYQVDQIYMSPMGNPSVQAYTSLMSQIAEKNIRVTNPLLNDRFSFQEVQFVVRSSYSAQFCNTLNDSSIVLQMSYFGRSVLFTGDAEELAEEAMLAQQSVLPLKSDVLKVAHHGSNTSYSNEFLSSVSPTYAVISCSDKQGTEYAADIEVGYQLVDCGVQDMFLTSSRGTIELIINPLNGEMTFSTEK